MQWHHQAQFVNGYFIIVTRWKWCGIVATFAPPPIPKDLNLLYIPHLNGCKLGYIPRFCVSSLCSITPQMWCSSRVKNPRCIRYSNLASENPDVFPIRNLISCGFPSHEDSEGVSVVGWGRQPGGRIMRCQCLSTQYQCWLAAQVAGAVLSEAYHCF